MPVSLFTPTSKIMKKFLYKIVLLFLLLFVIDYGVGVCFSWLVANAKDGDAARNYYICKKTSEDILIFGSSRASHHYNSNILRDSLNMPVYNCGMDGNGIILHYGRYEIISKRYHPKYVIYDIEPSFDLHEDNKEKYLTTLKPFYDEEGISDIFNDVDKNMRYKMLSSMYQYNSEFAQILINNIHPLKSSGINGFRPLEGKIEKKKTVKNKEKTDYEFDELKLSYMEKLIKNIGKEHFIFAISPTWSGMDSASYAPVMELARKYNIPFYNYSNDKKYFYNFECFKDRGHLNSKGADEFTKEFAHDLLGNKLIGKEKIK